MKKCLKTIMGAGLAAALVLSGCSGIADINEGDSNTTIPAAEAVQTPEAQQALQQQFL